MGSSESVDGEHWGCLGRHILAASSNYGQKAEGYDGKATATFGIGADGVAAAELNAWLHKLHSIQRTFWHMCVYFTVSSTTTQLLRSPGEGRTSNHG